MDNKPRLGVAAADKKAKDAEKKTIVETTEQDIFNQLHSLLMQTKVSHYATRSYSQHKALDRTYKNLNDLADSISEQIIGYSGTRIEVFNLGNVQAIAAADLANMIVNFGKDLQHWAFNKQYANIENLAQEISGVGAELKYLSTLA